MTEAEVFGRVAILADAAAWPELDEGDLAEAVNSARRHDLAGNPPENVAGVAGWVSGTYSAGVLVLESGRYWKVVVPGATAAVEPTWPTLTANPITPTTVVDGGVVWRDNGTVWAGTWDVPFAVAQAWQLKAGKVAGAHTFTTDGQVFNRAEVHRHCLAQVDRYLSQRAFVA